MSDVVKPRVITLCGSTRFPQAFELANMHLTMFGNIVLSCGLYGHADDPIGAKFLTSDGNENNPDKIALDELHKRKIDLADGIFVINVGGYVGSSTKGEIEYAKSQGKTVEYMFGSEYVFEPANFDNLYTGLARLFKIKREDAKTAVYYSLYGNVDDLKLYESVGNPYPDEISTERDPEEKLRRANEEMMKEDDTVGYDHVDTVGDLYTKLSYILNIDRDKIKTAMLNVATKDADYASNSL